MSNMTERNCNKCIHHTSGMCDSWNCKMQTVEDVKKEAVNEYVKAVVDELEEVKTINVDVGYGTIYKTIRKDIAIEIVKQGGVCGGCTEVGGCPVREDCPNEPNVCEWKCKGGFIKNPHTNRIFSNEESMKNIYCNTCGKKIKVVE